MVLWGLGYTADCACMNVAGYALRHKIIHAECVARKPCTALQVRKTMSLRSGSDAHYHAAAQHQKIVHNAQKDTHMLVDTLHKMVFSLDERLLNIRQWQQDLEKQKNLKKESYDIVNATFLKLNEGELQIMQWRLNVCTEIKQRQKLLETLHNEHKQIAGTVWTLDCIDNKFDK